MADEKPKAGKMSRSEIITVRLDPKLRYLASLGARKHRRTLSSYIEWAIENSLESVVLDEDFNGNRTTLATASAALWDVDDADKLVKLALRYPELLTHEEQVMWKLIRENGTLWRGHYNKSRTWEWSVDERSMMFERLRTYWPRFKAVADGEQPASTLPEWTRKDPSPASSSGFDDIDDEEIPF